MADDETEQKEYRWETGYEKTWEAIKEDEDGLVEGLVAEFAAKAARKRPAQQKGTVRLGMMRHLIVAVDCSEAMTSQDLKPTRFICTLKVSPEIKTGDAARSFLFGAVKNVENLPPTSGSLRLHIRRCHYQLLEGFIEEFFDQNPLSQLGIIAMKNKRAEKITELTGNMRKHIKAVQNLSILNLTGEPSLQNALDLAGYNLRPLPGHASREVLVLFASLTTCDPTDINTTIQALKADGIRCSVIGLAAEVRICKQLCQETGGDYGVVLDDVHYRSLLMDATLPPPRARTIEAGLIKMGFPHGEVNASDNNSQPIAVCMCHLEEGGESLSEGHMCPQCRSQYCELPVQCRTCRLTLASAPHLARSYHHLFPVDSYEEVKNEGQAENCFGCLAALEKQPQIHRCPNCSNHFCIDCEGLVQNSLHVCPGCASNPQAFQRLATRPAKQSTI